MISALVKSILNSDNQGQNNSSTEWIPLSEAAQFTPYSAEYLSLLARKRRLTSKKIDGIWYTTRLIVSNYLAQQAKRAEALNQSSDNYLPFISNAENSAPQDLSEPPSTNVRYSHTYVEDVQKIRGFVNETQAEIKPIAASETPTVTLPPVLVNPYEKKLAVPEIGTVPVTESVPMVADEVEITPAVRRETPASTVRAADVRKLVTPKIVELELPAEKSASGDLLMEEFMRRFNAQIDRQVDSQHGLLFKLGRFIRRSYGYTLRSPKRLPLFIVCLILVVILPFRFVSGFADSFFTETMHAVKNAQTVMGFRPGTHENEILLLGPAGEIAIFGNVETEGQFRSYVEDGIAPITVKSTAKVENLNADMLDGVSGHEFTLAYVTKNGNVTHEPVFLEGTVEVGQTLLVKGATKLLNSLEVDGNLSVFGDANFVKGISVSGPAVFKDILTAPSVIVSDLLRAHKLIVEEESIFESLVTIKDDLDVEGSITASSGRIKGSFRVEEGFHAMQNVSLGADAYTVRITSEDWSVDNDGNAIFVDIDGEDASFATLSVGGNVSASTFTATNPDATSTFQGALSIGTTTSNEMLTLDGAIYLASVAVPVATSSRLYNQDGTLYWGGSAFAGSSLGIWSTDGTNVWRTSGNVGIGTSTPNVRLHLSGGDVRFNDAGGGPGLYFDESTGRLGLGTTTPTTQLYVEGTDATALTLYRTDNDTNTNIAFQGNSSTVYAGQMSGTFAVGSNSDLSSASNRWLQSSANQHQFLISGSAAMTIDATGNIGIGTTTPAQTLTVAGSVRITGALFDSVASAGTSGMLLSSTGSGTSWIATSTLASNYFQQGGNSFGTTATLGTNDTNNLAFETNNTTRMTIDTNGNVGIGTTSPSAQLEVYGVPQLTAALTDAGVTTGMLALNGNSAAAGSGGALTFGNNQSVAAGSVGFAAIKGLLTNGGNNTAGDLAFSTRNAVADTALTERMRILANGNVGIGTTTPTTKLQIDGGGVVINGAIGSESGHFRGDSSLEISRAYTAGNGALISIFDATLSATTTSESAIAMGAYDSNGVKRKTTSISSKWANLDAATGFGVLRLNATYNAGLNDDVALRIFGNQGVQIFGTSETTGPGTGIFSVNGNLSVGSSSPDFSLGSTGSVIGVTNTGSNSSIFLGQSATANGHILWNYATNESNAALSMGPRTENDFFLKTNNTDRLRITAAGNVGVGTSTPSSKLSIVGAAGSSDILTVSSSTGSRLLTVTAAGNVGIGTSTPDSRMVISDNTENGIVLKLFQTSNSLSNGLLIQTGTSNAGDIVFGAYYGGSFSNPALMIRGNGSIGIGTTTATAAKLFVQGTAGSTDIFGLASSTGSRLLTVTSAGNVGIGVADPETKLEVAGGHILLSNNQALQFEDTGGANRTLVTLTSSDVATFGLSNNNTALNGFDHTYTASRTAGGADEAFLFTASTDMGTSDEVFQIADGGGSLLTVMGSGNVGIGTTTPDQKLQVVGGGIKLDNNQNIIWRNSANTGDTSVLALSGDTTILRGGGGTPTVQLQTTGGTAIMSLLENGNVGIGTTSPSAQLEVYGVPQLTAALTDAGVTTGMLALNGNSAAAGSGGALTFGNNQSVAAGSVGFAAIKGLLTNGGNNTAGDLAFSTRNAVADTALTERMRILANGNVGIGTTTPEYKLDVSSAGSAVGRLYSTDAASRLVFQDSGTGVNNTYIGSAGTAFQVTTGGSEKLRVTSTGNVGIGTTTPDALFVVGNTTGSQLRVSSTGTIVDGTWQADVIASTYLDTGILLATEIDTSAKIAGIVTDETGSGAVVFGTSPSISTSLTVTGEATDLATFYVLSPTQSGTNPKIMALYGDSPASTATERFTVLRGGNVGIGDATPTEGKLTVGGTLYVLTNTAVGADPLCWDGADGSVYGDCSSLAKWKTNVEDYDAGLEEILAIEAVTFDWKRNEDGTLTEDEDATILDPDTGFIAEQVASVSYNFGRYNKTTGALRDVNERGIMGAMVNAIKETHLSLEELLMTGSSTQTENLAALSDPESNSVWSRMVTLAESFVDGVLKIASAEIEYVKADKVETKELCVGSVCVDEGTFLQMVESSGGAVQAMEHEPEPEEETAEGGSSGTGGSEDDGEASDGATEEEPLGEGEASSEETEETPADTEETAPSDAVAEEPEEETPADNTEEVVAEESADEMPPETAG